MICPLTYMTPCVLDCPLPNSASNQALIALNIQLTHLHNAAPILFITSIPLQSHAHRPHQGTSGVSHQNTPFPYLPTRLTNHNSRTRFALPHPSETRLRSASPQQAQKSSQEGLTRRNFLCEPLPFWLDCLLASLFLAAAAPPTAIPVLIALRLPHVLRVQSHFASRSSHPRHARCSIS